MFCIHCGRPIPDGGGFCPSCGAMVESPARGDRRAGRPDRPSRNVGRVPDRSQRRQPVRPSPPVQPPLDQGQLWIERDDALGSLMRYLHAQDHGRWRTIAMGAAIVAGLSLLLPWYTFSFLGGFDVLDFLNVFGEGIRSTDWLLIAIACGGIVVTLYLGHPMGSLVGCVFLCYFVVSNLTSLLWTLGFMRPTLGFLVYGLAVAVTTYGCLAAGGLEELNLFLPGTAPRAGFTYPDPTDPHIPRGDAF